MDAIREHVIALFCRGELSSLQEGALIAGVSRVTVRAWLRAAQVDWQRQRAQYLARHRSRAVARANGHERPKPTKQHLRRIAVRAKQQWDRSHENH